MHGRYKDGGAAITDTMSHFPVVPAPDLTGHFCCFKRAFSFALSHSWIQAFSPPQMPWMYADAAWKRPLLSNIPPVSARFLTESPE